MSVQMSICEAKYRQSSTQYTSQRPPVLRALCQTKQENGNGKLNEAICEDDEDRVEIQPCEQRQHPLRMVLKDFDVLSQAEAC